MVTHLPLSPQIDYFERAKRLEEIPPIKKAYEEQRVKDMELWELQEEERVCNGKQIHCEECKGIQTVERLIIQDLMESCIQILINSVNIQVFFFLL